MYMHELLGLHATHTLTDNLRCPASGISPPQSTMKGSQPVQSQTPLGTCTIIRKGTPHMFSYTFSSWEMHHMRNVLWVRTLFKRRNSPRLLKECQRDPQQQEYRYKSTRNMSKYLPGCTKEKKETFFKYKKGCVQKTCHGYVMSTSTSCGIPYGLEYWWWGPCVWSHVDYWWWVSCLQNQLYICKLSWPIS